MHHKFVIKIKRISVYTDHKDIIKIKSEPQNYLKNQRRKCIHDQQRQVKI